MRIYTYADPCIFLKYIHDSQIWAFPVMSGGWGSTPPWAFACCLKASWDKQMSQHVTAISSDHFRACFQASGSTVRIQSCAKDNFANKRQLSSKTLSFVEYANLSLYMACSNILEMTIIGRKAISAAHSANAARSRPARREVPRGKTKFTHESF